MNDLIKVQHISDRIFTIRGMQGMLDFHLAEMYDTKTFRLNEQVKRNANRFPPEFMFQLTKDEYENLISQFAISSLEHGGRRSLPYAFTEQGVAMLSAILRSETAVRVSIQIMHAFVEMRHLLGNVNNLQLRVANIESTQIGYDQKFEKVFKALEAGDTKRKQGVFFDGQIFDAYNFVAELIRSAEKSIVLFDNFIDDSVLLQLSKRKTNVSATIYTKNISKTLELDLQKHNAQYPPITLKLFDKAHDRFLIIDDKKVYHIGASLKDLGKKWFAFSLLEKNSVAPSIFDKIKE